MSVFFYALDEPGTGVRPYCIVCVKVGCIGYTEILGVEIPAVRLEIPMPRAEILTGEWRFNKWWSLDSRLSLIERLNGQLASWQFDLVDQRIRSWLVN